MVIIVDKTTTEQELQTWLNKVRTDRTKHEKVNLSKYFGILPDIGDGMKIQNEVRDEWN